MQPLGVYEGTRPNPNILYGQQDLTNAPTTFNKYGTRWGDVQLIDAGAPGWVISPLRSGSIYSKTGYLYALVPTMPGLTRLVPGGHVPNGPAPSQVAQAYASTAGQQPQYPGGPGQMLAPGGLRYMGGAGA